MSQNKTVTPGMEYSDYQRPQSGYSTMDNHSVRGTIVQNMDNADNYTNVSGNRVTAPTSSKPVVGFLYSVSRQNSGEYWPLYLGENTIGKSSSCHICLSEGTVSENHAVLMVRKMKNPAKTIAFISDTRSTNGTMVNDMSVGSSSMDCSNGDIITIGESYELLLILIDTQALGLKVATNFIPVDKDEPVYDEPDSPIGRNQRSTRPGTPNIPPRFNPSGIGGMDYDPDIRRGPEPMDGTVGLSGGAFKKGGTTV